MLATSLLAAAMILWMQGRYETSDEKHAIEIVQGYRSRAGVSIPDVLERRHPDDSVRWSSSIKSSCFQHIEVQATVDTAAAPPAVYAFVVDINGPAIHPGNEAGKEVLAAIDQPLPPRATATAPATATASPATPASAAPTASAATPASPAPTASAAPPASAAPTSAP